MSISSKNPKRNDPQKEVGDFNRPLARPLGLCVCGRLLRRPPTHITKPPSVEGNRPLKSPASVEAEFWEGLEREVERAFMEAEIQELCTPERKAQAIPF